MVPVDTIYKPIAAIPHQGGNPGHVYQAMWELGVRVLQMIEE
jgi:hypothetical protein